MLRFWQQFTYKPMLPYSTKDHVSHDDIHQNSYRYEPRNSLALSHHWNYGRDNERTYEIRIGIKYAIKSY